MINLDDLNQTLTMAVEDAVTAQSERLNTGEMMNRLIASILEKPVMSFPEDVQAVLKMGRNTALELPKDPDFPPLIEIGQKRFVNPQKFMAFLAAKEAA